MGARWPFALFVLVYLDHKTINELIEASIGPYAPTLWLATDNYDDPPKKQYEYNDGTIPPIPEDFKSPWIGRQLDSLVEWIKAKPEETDINDRHFAVLDRGAREDPPTIVVCRIGDHNAEGDELFLLRKEPLRATEHLSGAPADAWDEAVRYRGNAEIEYDDEV